MLTQAFVSLLVAGLGLALATPDLSVDLAARQNADSSSLLGSLVQSLPTKVKLGSFTYDAKNVTSKDGTSIVIEAIGDRSKPHVVFAHGLAADMTFFDMLFARPEMLASVYAVRYDTRGHGRSGKPVGDSAYLGQRYVEDFQAVTKAFNLSKPFFAGWSLGASIAVDLVAQNVSLSGIIYIGPVPYVGGEYASNILPLRYEPNHGLLPGMLSTDDVALALSARVGWANTLVAPSRLPSIPFQEKVKWIGSGAELSPYACAGSLFRPQDPEDLFRAGANGMPLLLLYGKEDRQMDGQKVYNALAPKFRVIERVALDNVGHMPFYEEPGLTANYLLDFVRRRK